MSTGGKQFREGHIECSKVLCRPDAVRPLVCTLKRDSDGAQIARPLGWNQGCGGSMICQTNDVGLHKDVRADFIAKQTEKLLEHARSKGGGLCDLTAEENISLMCEVMSKKDLHLKAADSYKWTGTTNALDGSEDELIAGDARQFWGELNMRQEVDEAMTEVEEEWKAGNLKWTFKDVYSLVGEYPRRGQMDEWRPGMDDEATPDPDPHP